MSASTKAPLGRILLIEDDALLAASMRELLELSDFEVVQPTLTNSTTTLIKTGSFDCVVLDQQSVLEQNFLQLVQAAEVPLIVISSVQRVEAALSAFRSGARDFLLKPCDPDRLIRVLHSAVGDSKTSSAGSATLAKQGDIWFKYLADTSSDVVYALDSTGHFTYINQRAEQLLGLASDDLIGKHYSNLVHEADRERARWVFDERRTGKRAAAGLELRLIGRQRQDDPLDQRTKVLTVSLNASGLYRGVTNTANFIGSCGFARDISERKRAEDQIYARAYHDLLTGLPNRLLLRDHLVLAMAHAKRNGGLLAVMFIDLDRFKQVNDTLGHAAGDELLKGVATRLGKSIREGDTLARIGGDEFVAVLPQVTSREAAAQAARKLLDVLTTPFALDKHELFIGASIGISFYPDDAESAEALLRNADRAMYDAKSHGRNTFVIYSHDKHVQTQTRSGLDQELDRAVRGGELTLYYQPQIDSQTKELVAMEALLRWQHPTRGVISAEDFIDTAEDTGSMASVDEWVMRSAMDQAKQWHDTGLNGFNLALNMSMRQLQSRDFLRRFASNLQRAQLDPKKVVIEVSETRMARDPDLVQQRLKVLAELGVQVCIDNFGTGGMSFNYLRSLPVKSVKLDRSLVRDLTPNTDQHPIPRAMVLVAQAMKVELQAHGVENEYQLNFLREQACHAWQGYLYAKPLSTAAATQLLAARIMGRDLPKAPSDG